LQQLGRDAGVRFILRGKLLASTDTISVAVQLDDASSGAMVWNETINGELTDLFALQDKVTQHVRASMGPALLVSAAHSSKTRKSNLRAADAILNARALTLQPTSLENVQRTTAWYREALKIEPDSAAAQFGLAGTLYLYASHFSSTLTPQQSSAAMNEAQTVANKAMRIDPQNLEGLHLSARIAVAQNECPKGEQLMQSLLIAEPKNVRVLAELGDLRRFEGDPAKGIPMLKRAMELEPKRSDWVAGLLGKAYVALGDADSAIPYLQKGMQAQPNVPDIYAWLALAFELKGDKKHIQENRERLHALAPGFRTHDLDQSFSACSQASAAYWNEHVGAVAARVGIPP
jgi:adenylate cyclase